MDIQTISTRARNLVGSVWNYEVIRLFPDGPFRLEQDRKCSKWRINMKQRTNGFELLPVERQYGYLLNHREWEN